jgi:DNA polymerase III delta' subunit
VSGTWRRETRGGAPGPDAAAPTARLVRPLGQGEMLARWLRQARRLQLPHAIVVEGAPGIGKTTVMRWLAAALLCPSDIDLDEPCGVCRTCCRIAAGSFADLHVVDRAHDEQERKEWKKSFYVIRVDQVRAAQEVLARQAVEGRARVLLLASADRMDEEAQNALLKTLEEPGSATFLLLEARRPEQLLPTVRSRAQRLRLSPLDEPTIRRELAQRIPGRSGNFDRAIATARGSLGAALLLCTEQVVQVHDLVHACLAGAQGLRPVATARAVLEHVEGRWREIEAARTFLWLFRSELRARLDALAAAAGASYPVALAEPWTTWLESTLAAERDLDLQIPPEQVLTACLVACAASGVSM